MTETKNRVSSILIDRELIAKLKIRAAQERTNIKTIVEQLITNYIK